MHKASCLSICLFLVALFLSACNQTRYVPKDKYLLADIRLKGDMSGLKMEELKSCLIQKPARSTLVALYSFSKIEKQNWWNRTLRSFGEEPVIMDADYTAQSVINLTKYVKKKGYYNVIVTDSIRLRKQKAFVVLKIETGAPYTIRNFSYSISDTTLRNFVLGDSLNRLFQRGDPFDDNLLSQERIRIESYLRDNGYFKFSREFISYDVDTFLNSKKVDLVLNIKNYDKKDDDSIVGLIQHPRYKIQQVVISTSSEMNGVPVDTVFEKKILFTYSSKHWVKPSILQQSNYILPDSLFRASDVDNTKSHLTSLNVYGLVNCNQFVEDSTSDSLGFRYLNSKILLIPLKMQSYQWELEGTTSSSDMGGALNLIYQHRSLFGNAENFTLKLKGALGTDRRGNLTQFNRILEYGADASLHLPEFLLPFNTSSFTKKYNPSTIVGLSFIFQERRYYTYYGAAATFGYEWKIGRNFRHVINPIEFNVVNVPRKNDSIVNTWGSYMKKKFVNHFISAIGYTFEYRTQEAERGMNYGYIRAHIETAGNALSLYSKLANTGVSKNTYYTLLNTRFSQYSKSDVDFRLYHTFNESKSLASRLFLGCAFPYGNANTVPFEKQYFGGGANSLRGWSEKTLGLGSLKDSAVTKDISGDVKIEANLEYRNSLFWILEGALFVDAGNVWALSPDVAAEGQFGLKRFYKEFAVSSGAGIRLKLGFTVLRFDLGMKVRNPSAPKETKWCFQKKLTFKDDFTLCFGIDYPF